MTVTIERMVDAMTSVVVVGTGSVRAGMDIGPVNTTTYVVKQQMPSVSELIGSGTGYGSVTDSSDRNFSLSLRRIQEHSGLSWGEIARTLGVSRRTVHNWLTSARVSGVNAMRVAGLYRAITQELTHVPRDAARDHLLAPGADGTRLAKIARDLRVQYPHKRPPVGGFGALQSAAAGADVMITGGLDEAVEVIESDLQLG